MRKSTLFSKLRLFTFSYTPYNNHRIFGFNSNKYHLHIEQLILSHNFGHHIFFPVMVMHVHSPVAQISESFIAITAIVLLDSHMDAFNVINDVAFAFVFCSFAKFAHPCSLQMGVGYAQLLELFSPLSRRQVQEKGLEICNNKSCADL